MAMALPFIGAAVAALGSFQQSRQQGAVSDYNARVAQQNALQERAWGEADAIRMREDASRQRARIRTATAAAGVDVGTGSIIDVLSDDAIRAELAALDIVARGEGAARAQEAQAAGFRMEARFTRRAAPLSALGAGLSGFAAGRSLR
jgi:hypothetical protein